MVNNNDLINLVNNKKPVEEVREIENEIPSFEEFMKNYESDGNLNYAHNLEDSNWYAANVISNEVLRKCATLVREAVRHHDRGNRVKGYVEVQGKFWGGYEWYRSY